MEPGCKKTNQHRADEETAGCRPWSQQQRQCKPCRDSRHAQMSPRQMCEERLCQSSFRPCVGDIERSDNHGPPADRWHAYEQCTMFASRQRSEPGVSQAECEKQPGCSDRTDVPIPHDRQTSLRGSPACQAVHHIRQASFVKCGHLCENLDRGKDQTHAETGTGTFPQPKIEVEQRLQSKMIQYRLMSLFN